MLSKGCKRLSSSHYKGNLETADGRISEQHNQGWSTRVERPRAEVDHSMAGAAILPTRVQC